MTIGEGRFIFENSGFWILFAVIAAISIIPIARNIFREGMSRATIWMILDLLIERKRGSFGSRIGERSDSPDDHANTGGSFTSSHEASDSGDRD